MGSPDGSQVLLTFLAPSQPVLVLPEGSLVPPPGFLRGFFPFFGAFSRFFGFFSCFLGSSLGSLASPHIFWCLLSVFWRLQLVFGASLWVFFGFFSDFLLPSPGFLGSSHMVWVLHHLPTPLLLQLQRRPLPQHLPPPTHQQRLGQLHRVGRSSLSPPSRGPSHLKARPQDVFRLPSRPSWSPWTRWS